MSEALVITPARELTPAYTARELVTVLFRHKRPAMLVFFAVLAAALLAALLLPSYHAEMKLLVKHERVDPIISGDQGSSQILVAPPEITEEEMNSEVELLTSGDLLRQVVLANHLEQQVHSSWLHGNDPERKIALAVRHLRSHLQVQAVRKTNVIDVTLSSRNPGQAASILDSLATLYLEKHAEVNRSGGQLAFFEQQTEQAKKDLAEAEGHLRAFNEKQQVAAPDLERDNTLQKLADVTLSLEQTRAAVRETQHRIATLEKLETSTPSRITTQLQQGDNPQLMQQLKSTLLNLELKRTELLTKYLPNYPLVQEVEKQIAETQSAIGAENARPVRQETTDQNPTEQWVCSELAKAEADLSGLRAREVATAAAVKSYQAAAQELNQKGIAQQDLVRSAKAAEQNYLLYLRKREEARISEALDRRRILNVAVAQEPIVPALPARSGAWYLLLGTLGAIFAGVATTFFCEYFDDTFRTPDEMRRELRVPVIAALPYYPQLSAPAGSPADVSSGQEVA